MQLNEAVEAFSQIRDRARAKDLLATAFHEVTDYQISWDEFQSVVDMLKRWHLGK
jgi:hypothetical protein